CTISPERKPKRSSASGGSRDAQQRLRRDSCHRRVGVDNLHPFPRTFHWTSPFRCVLLGLEPPPASRTRGTSLLLQFSDPGLGTYLATSGDTLGQNRRPPRPPVDTLSVLDRVSCSE